MMDWRDEYDAAIAERNRLIMALTAAEKRAEAAERRVAELEARLAEQEWRPVTGDSGEFDEYRGTDIEMRTTELWQYDEILEAWSIKDYALNEEWRPLPPPPAATE